MAAAVAVGEKLPLHFENEDSSDDDNFADELEAQLFEAEADEIDLTREEERDEKRGSTRRNRPPTGWSAAPAGWSSTAGGEGLAGPSSGAEPADPAMALPRGPHELRHDVRGAEAPPRRIHYGADASAPGSDTRSVPGVRSWRALYFPEDARELRLTASSAPDLRHLYAQMHAKSATAGDAHRRCAPHATDAENEPVARAAGPERRFGPCISTHVFHVANGCSIAGSERTFFVCERTGRAQYVATTRAARGLWTWTGCGDVFHIRTLFRQVPW